MKTYRFPLLAAACAALLAPLAGQNVASGGVTLQNLVFLMAGRGAGSASSGTPVSPTSISITHGRNIAMDAAGDIFIADSGTAEVYEIAAATGQLTVVAGGGALVPGSLGGLPESATGDQLTTPTGIAVDTLGNLYIADSGLNKVFVVTAGNILTFAGGGSNAPSTAAASPTSVNLNAPAGVAVDVSGNVYIADTGNNEVEEIYAAGANAGNLVVIAGGGAGTPSTTAALPTTLALSGPDGVAADARGNVYIADTGHNEVLETSAATGQLAVIAGGGSTAPSTTAAAATTVQLNGPQAVAADPAGNIFIADTGNNEFEEIPSGSANLTVIAGGGSTAPSATPELPSAAQFSGAYGLAVDAAGDVILGEAQAADELSTGATLPATSVGATSASQTLYVELTAASPVTQIVAALPTGGTAEFTLGTVSGCTVDSTGATTDPAGTICQIPVTFTPSHAGPRPGEIVLANGTAAVGSVGVHGLGLAPQVTEAPGGLTLLAGSGAIAPSATLTTATSIKLNAPGSVAEDVNGTIYIADTQDNQIVVIPAGGSQLEQYLTSLSAPASVVLDAAHNLYIADTGNNRVLVVTTKGQAFLVAGTGSTPPAAMPASATGVQLSGPAGLAVDANGNVYIADSGHNEVEEVYAGTGQIAVIAGGGANTPGTTPAPATGVKLNDPTGLAVDAAGNVYIADSGDNEVEEVLAFNGQLVVLAGGGSTAPSASAAGATTLALSAPKGLAVDAAGNLYIADSGHNQIEEYYAGGALAVIAGGGAATPAATATAATAVSLNAPAGVALDGAGNLLIAGGGDNLIESVTASAQALSFPQTNPGSTSAAQTVTVANAGDQPLAIAVPSSGDNPSISANFSLDSSPSVACPVVASTASGPSVLGPGSYCTLTLAFAPTANGSSISGSATLTDNNLNGSNVTQSVAMSGSSSKSTDVVTFTPPTTETYGSAPITLSATGSSTGAITFQVISGPATLSGSTLTFTGAGSVLVEADQAADSNYNAGTIQQTIRVNQASLTITASNGTMTYGGTPPTITPSYTGFVNGDTALSLTTAPTCTTSATSASAASSAQTSSCSGAAAANYSIIYAGGTVTVGKAALTITASNGTMTYGGTPPTITPSYSGFVNGDTAISLTTAPTCSTSATSASAASSAQTSSCSGAAAANYSISYAAGTVTVGKASLTVTAPNLGVQFGTVPVITPTYSGFVNGDTVAVLTAGAECGVNTSAAVGAATVTCTSAAAANYTFTYVSGTATITPEGVLLVANGSFGLNNSFPQTPAGSISASQTIDIQLTVAGPISAITAAAAPSPNGNEQEFTLGAISGCTVDGTTSNPLGTVCQVPVIFSPAYPGLRSAAITVTSGSTTLGTVGVYGIGLGPEAALSPGNYTAKLGSVAIPGSGLTGVAVDADGNIYFADSTNEEIKELSAGGFTVIASGATSGPAPTTAPKPSLSVTLQSPRGLTVDAAGNVYFVDGGAGAVIDEIFTATGQIATIAGGNSTGPQPSTTARPATSVNLSNPSDVAVDAAGNVYVADTSGHTVDELYAASGDIQVIAGGGSSAVFPTATPQAATSLTLGSPSSVAVDASGDLFIADAGSAEILELYATGANSGKAAVIAGGASSGPAVGGTPQAATAVTLKNPQSVATDAAGNVYLTELDNKTVDEVYAATGTIATILDQTSATSLAVDFAGNIDLVNNSQQVDQISATAAPLTFPATAVGSASPSQTVTFTNVGNQPLSLIADAAPSGFSLAAGSTCPLTRSQLAAGDTCTTALSFTPTSAGATTGSLTYTDNSPNSANASQTVSLSGTGLTAQTISFSLTSPVTYGAGPIILSATGGASGNPVTFSIKSGTNVALSGAYFNVVNITGAGTVVIAANQAAGSTYAAAPEVTQLLVVNPAPLTITASSATITAGAAAPTITPSYTGFVNGDTAPSLTTAPTCTTTATSTSVPGTYPSTCSGATAANYTITYVSGSVTVLAPAPPLVLLPELTQISQMTDPQGVAMDAAGNIYVGVGNEGEVAEITPDGTSTIIIGGPNASGTPTTTPEPATSVNVGVAWGLALDASGNLYIADNGQNQVDEYLAASKTIVVIAGKTGGAGVTATLSQATNASVSPKALAVGPDGNVYIVDGKQIDELYTFGANAGMVQVIASQAFAEPVAVTVDGVGNVYVADSTAHEIFKFNPTASPTTPVVIAGGGTITPGTAAMAPLTARLNGPAGLAVDAAGNVFISDTGTLEEISAATGQLQVVAGGGNAAPAISGTLATAASLSPQQISAAPNGNLVINGTGIVAVYSNGAEFPVTEVGSTSASHSVFLQVNVPTTKFAIAATTGLGGHQEFTLGTVSGCTLGGATAAGAICTVPASFSPAYPGLRSAAVTVADGSTTLGTVGVYGLGQGPGVVLSPGVTSVVAGGGSNPVGQSPVSPSTVSLYNPGSAAVDAAGNLYIGEQDGVDEVDAADGKIRQIAGGHSYDIGNFGVTTDTAGNVYILDWFAGVLDEKVAATGQIVRIAGGGSSAPSTTPQNPLAVGFSSPSSVAVDAAGDIYIADARHNEIEEIDATSGQLRVIVGGLSNPNGVALDAAGNLYIADTGNGEIKKLPKSGGPIQVIASGLTSPAGLAVDAAGNLYMDELGGVFEVDAADGKTRQIFDVGPGVVSNLGVITTDAAGNIYVPDPSDNTVKEITASAAPLTFPSTATGMASSTQTMTVMSIGNQPLAFTVPGIGMGNNPDVSAGFGLDSTASTACPMLAPGASAAGALAPGATCTLSVQFAPAAVGTDAGSLTLADNSLNAAGATQSVALSGTGTAASGTTPALAFSNGTTGEITSLDFGSQLVGTTSGTQTVLVSSANVQVVTSVTAGGDFHITATECDNITLTGTGCPIDVTFTPTAVGARSSNLIVNTSLGVYSLALTGTGAPFVLANSGVTAVTLGSGGQGAATLSLTSATLSGPVTLSCSGLPANSTCVFNPNPVTVSPGGAPVQVTVTIQTAARTMAPPALNLPPGGAPPAWPAPWLWALLGLLLSAAATLARRRRVLLGLLAGAALVAAGCGGVSNLPTAGGGTPAGTYTVRVNATSGQFTISIPIVLTVE